MTPALAFLKALAWVGRPQSKSQTRQRLVLAGDQIVPSKLKWTNRKASPKLNQMAKLNGKPTDKLEEVYHDANFITLRARQSRNDNEPKQSTPSDGSQKKNGAFKTKRTKETEKVEARQKKKVLTKKEFGNIVATLRTISVTILVEFIQNVIKSERHLTVFHDRTEIIKCLRSSREFEPLLQRLFNNGLGIVLSCFSNKPNDRPPVFKLRFVHHMRDILKNKSSSKMMWSFTNFKETDGSMKSHLSCVLHSLGVGIFQFIQKKVMKIKQLKQQSQKNRTEKTVCDSEKSKCNSTLSLLTLAGGSFGKIYKCVKRFIKRNAHTTDKGKCFRRNSYIKFKKFLWQLVMSKREKEHPCLPEPLKQRDRGWLFIPKWVFLPYLRLLDRCIRKTASQDGLKLYKKNLVMVRKLCQLTNDRVKPKFLENRFKISFLEFFKTDPCSVETKKTEELPGPGGRFWCIHSKI